MAQFFYGIWNGIVCDNRNAEQETWPNGFPSQSCAEFNPGNNALSFVAPQGFILFSKEANLPYAFLKYYTRIAKESCGRCSPCRSGAPKLREALELACAGRANEVDWEEIKAIASQMVTSSLCGIGKTGPQALLDALNNAPELLTQAKAVTEPKGDEYSVLTSRCMEACPSHVDIPRYMDCVNDGENDLALGVLLKHYPLVGSCGRVCVRFCESACRRKAVDAAIDIKQIKRFAADALPVNPVTLFSPTVDSSKPSVAVIGAGPAGINCAYQLLLRGYPVTIFEANPWSGGMARVGIPPYRLPKDKLKEEGDIVAQLGGKYEYGKALGKDFTINDLFAQGFKAIFLGVGCSSGQYLGVPDEDTSLKGYQNGIDFLRQVHDGVVAGNPPKMEGDVVVVGGGNVAMDCCRSAVRLTNGKVYIVYRRTEADAPADVEEIEAAKEEGVEFKFMTLQDRILSENGEVSGMTCIKMADGGKDSRGRTNVVPIPDSNWTLPCKHVIAAIGQYMPTDIFCEADGISYDKRGRITIDEKLQTTREGVFSGGDCAAGPKTLIEAMAQGEQAALSIVQYLNQKEQFLPRVRMGKIIIQGQMLSDACPAEPTLPISRAPLHSISPAQRDHSFAEVDQCLSAEEAQKEAARCMRCYRLFSVVTEGSIPGKED